MFLLEFFIIVLILYALKLSLYPKNKVPVLHNFDVNCTIALRALLALTIVLHHVIQNVEPIPIVSQITVWGPYIVAVFFFISGYGLSVSYIEKGDSSLAFFLKRRFLRILFPFFLCVLFYQIVLIFFIKEYDFFKCLVAKLPDFTDVILPTSWFVYVILLLYFLYYTIMKITKSLKMGIVILFLLSLIVFYLFWQFKLGGWWRYSIFAFNIGMFFAYHESKIKSIVLKKTNCILILAIVISVLLYNVFPFLTAHYMHDEITLKIYSQLDSVLGPTIFPLFIVLILYVTGITINHILMFLGRISLEIYLSQGAVCTILSQWNFCHENPFSYFSIVLAASILFAYMLNKLVDKLKVIYL